MPDLNAAIKNHHAEMALWWKKPEYIKARKEFCKRNPVCIRCGRKCQTPGHSAEDYRHGYEHYLEQVRQDCCDPLCNQCNRKEAKSMKPCPVCVKENKGGKPWYIGQDQEYCYIHRPAEEIQRSEDRKEIHKMLVKQSQKITNAKRRAIYQEMKRK
jgi:hypothetical protein